jgi:hypothetical protein
LSEILLLWLEDLLVELTGCLNLLPCLLKTNLLDLVVEKRTLSFISDFSETTMFLIILLATSTVLIPLGLNQNQIAIAQQQKLQGSQNNQTSSSLTKQQQPTGISFQIEI